MATLNTSATYILSNLFLGAGKLLAVPSTNGNSEPEMLSSTSGSPSSDAQWFLTPTNMDPFYRLHTRSGGESLSLDVVNSGGASGSTDLQMAPTGEYSGQLWRFDEWPSSSNTPFRYRLSNNFTGLDKHLDTYSDTFVPFLGDGDHTGQHWNLQVFGNTKSEGTATATATGTGTVTGARSVTGTGGAGGGLSVGGIVGIVVGGVAALGLLVLGILFIIMRSKRKSRSRAAAVEQVAVADVKSEGPPPVYDASGVAAYVEAGGRHEPAELSTGSVPVRPAELPGGA